MSRSDNKRARNVENDRRKRLTGKKSDGFRRKNDQEEPGYGKDK